MTREEKRASSVGQTSKRRSPHGVVPALWGKPHQRRVPHRVGLQVGRDLDKLRDLMGTIADVLGVWFFGGSKCSFDFSTSLKKKKKKKKDFRTWVDMCLQGVSEVYYYCKDCGIDVAVAEKHRE